MRVELVEDSGGETVYCVIGVHHQVEFKFVEDSRIDMNRVAFESLDVFD